jgi:hypothetical protein
VDAKRDTLPVPPPTRGGFWRGVLHQPGRDPFVCTLPFQAVSESEAIDYVARLTGRPRKELSVEAVSSPGLNTKKGQKK